MSRNGGGHRSGRRWRVALGVAVGDAAAYSPLLSLAETTG